MRRFGHGKTGSFQQGSSLRKVPDRRNKSNQRMRRRRAFSGQLQFQRAGGNQRDAPVVQFERAPAIFLGGSETEVPAVSRNMTIQLFLGYAEDHLC